MIIEKRAGNCSQKLANADLGVRLLLFTTHPRRQTAKRLAGLA